MLQITIRDREQVAGDPLGRDAVGYAPDLSPARLFEAARGCWVMDADKARQEHYALFVYSGRLPQVSGKVVQAVRIDGITTVDTPDGKRRSVIEGRVLRPGDPVHDAFVGKTAPAEAGRNPVKYFADPLDAVPCRCGCGTPVQRGQFVAGHDAQALYARVARIGTVAEFLDWFDAQIPTA